MKSFPFLSYGKCEVDRDDDKMTNSTQLSTVASLQKCHLVKGGYESHNMRMLLCQGDLLNLIVPALSDHTENETVSRWEWNLNRLAFGQPYFPLLPMMPFLTLHHYNCTWIISGLLFMKIWKKHQIVYVSVVVSLVYKHIYMKHDTVTLAHLQIPDATGWPLNHWSGFTF